MSLRRLLLASLAIGSLALAACASDDADVGSNDDDLSAAKADDAWFYSGELPALEDPNVTVSLAGHTAHVVGYLPRGKELPELPHVKQKDENGRRRVDVVYPIATARPGKSNSKPGTYALQMAKPYRPNGGAWTREEGDHFVPWGGFPFIAYNGGIAFHGPITSLDSKAPGGPDAWYLHRGQASAGCNRMMGEHVVELAHVLGIDMRKVYGANVQIRPQATKVAVIADYDQLDGKYIDVDYPTDTGAKRPASVYGASNVVMFGSWVASEMPNGRDLPPDMKWEGGVSGKYYVFQEHARQGVVCSVPKRDLAALKASAARRPNAELPGDFCATKAACDARLEHVCSPAELGL
jgi:hypothetical protein